MLVFPGGRLVAERRGGKIEGDSRGGNGHGKEEDGGVCEDEGAKNVKRNVYPEGGTRLDPGQGGNTGRSRRPKKKERILGG